MIFSILIGLAALLLISYVWLKAIRPKNFPPGPIGIPFFGNILFMGSKPHLTILKWKQKYGDTFSFHDGSKFFVVLSNFHTLRRVLGEDVTAGRYPTMILRSEQSSLPMGYGLLASEGTLWKSHRRFALSTLRDLGMGKNWLEDLILEEIESVIQAIKRKNKQPFNPKATVTNSVSNVICGLAFGKRFSLSDPKFTRLTSSLANYVANIKIEFIVEAFPFLMRFPNPVRSRVIKSSQILRDCKEFMKEIVADHDEKNASKETGVEDYLIAYQKERESGSRTNVKETFDDQQLLGTLFDLFIAGTDTTSTTILWSMVFMIENPDVMRRVHEEIDNTVGRERMLTNADRPLLPYTEAVVLEALRCGSLLPLSIPHRALEEITIDGYTIPKDTIIAPNIYSIHRDSRWWKDPLSFDPSRFLDENQKLLRPDGFVPFSIGKRACLGESLARMELFLFIANMMRVYTLVLPPGKTLSHEDYYASLIDYPNPFELIFVPRA